MEKVKSNLRDGQHNKITISLNFVQHELIPNFATESLVAVCFCAIALFRTYTVHNLFLVKNFANAQCAEQRQSVLRIL